MTDTPKEIWCSTGLYWDYKDDWSEGSWRDNDNCAGVKYVRADRIEELEAKLAQQDDLVQAANRLAEYLNGDHIYMERVHHLAAAIRKGGE